MAKQRVLIIDDDRDIADLFSIILGTVGYECEIVYTAREGLAKLSLYIPDIVLLDLRLGYELGGEDILYQIRSNPRLDQTRVVVITGYPSMAEPITNLTDLTLLKPVDIHQLKTLIQRMTSTEKKPGTEYFRDPVTGLFHQEFFQTRLEHAFQRKKRLPDLLYAVIVFSLDFDPSLSEQEVHDDLTLIVKNIATNLLRNFRPTDTIARFSTYKYASLHEDLKSPGDFQIVMNRMRAGILQVYYVKERPYRPVLSMGGALSEDWFQKPEDILEAAEAQMKSIPFPKEIKS